MSDKDIANLNIVTLLLPADRTASAATPTGVDVTAFEGNIACIVESAVGTGTTPTFDLKLQHSDSISGTYTDITGAAITQITDAAAGALNRQKIIINSNNIKAFVRAPTVISGTSPHFISSAILVGTKQYNP